MNKSIIARPNWSYLVVCAAVAACKLWVYLPIASASSGWYDAALYYSTDGGSTTSSNNYSTLNGLNYGEVVVGASTLFLKGGQVNTWKDGGGYDDVTGANLYYRIYPGTSASGDFTQVNLPFGANLGGNNNQSWLTTAQNVNLASGLTASGAYSVQYFYTWISTTNFGASGPITNYISNSGNNYTTSFSPSGNPPA